MSVHLQIKDQMNKFISAEKKYKQLDMIREQKIEEVLREAKENRNFSLLEVNTITEEINEISKSFGFPLRKHVTKDMVFEFINRKM